MIVSCNATRATHQLNRNFLKSLPLYVYHLRLAMQVDFYTQCRILLPTLLSGGSGKSSNEAAIKRFEAWSLTIVRIETTTCRKK